MSCRTSPEQVQGVLLKDYDSVDSPSLVPFITAANLVVTQVKSCANKKGVSLSTDELQQIETWLAAHMYVMSDKVLIEEGSLSARGKYQGQTGMNINASFYGQTAAMIDHSGCLSAISQRKVVGFHWLGKTSSEKIPLQDRD